MTTEELNALKDRAYKTAVAHGFHEEEKPDAFCLGLVMSEMGEAHPDMIKVAKPLYEEFKKRRYIK